MKVSLNMSIKSEGRISTSLNSLQLLEMYEKMLLIRAFEQKVQSEFAKEKIQGFIHLSIGQEAVAVGSVYGLRKDDYITPSHRGHGMVIAKGLPIRNMFAELLGKTTGVCGGKGGSFHMVDLSLGIFPINGILGASSPIATGSALVFNMKNTDQVHVCFFGDGQVNEGAVHEAMNFASVKKLPVVFVCENNLYASAGVKHTIFLPIEDIAERGKAYSMPSEVVDGMDPIVVYEAVQRAVKRARCGGGPSLLECKTYRFVDHVEGYKDLSGPKEQYRSEEEVQKWKRNDPIKKIEAELFKAGNLTEERREKILGKIKTQVEEAYQQAEQDPQPDPNAVLEHVYAP